MTEKDLFLWLAANRCLEISDKENLMRYYGSPLQIWETDEESLYKAGFTPRVASSLIAYKKIFNPDMVYDRLRKSGIKFTAICDSQYPDKLRYIPSPPLGLFYKGKLPSGGVPSVAVIGARTCSSYGSSATDYIVSELVENGVQIISGLAYGIDGQAHKSALKNGGKTFGVLGTGADIIYPAENSPLFYEMYEKGGVISEYFLGVKGLKKHFPERNRIIAGLADCLLVVEAKMKSGTMTTTDRALEQGKEVFVVPGRIGDVLSEGCLYLAKQGAGIATSAEDIIFSLKSRNFNKFFKEKNDKNKKSFKFGKNTLENNEIIVYALLSFSAKHFEELMIESGLDYFTLFDALNGLCEKGFAVEIEAGSYVSRSVSEP